MNNFPASLAVFLYRFPFSLQVKVLFVRNLMYCTSEEQIRAKFEELASADSVEQEAYTGAVDRVKKTKVSQSRS